MSTFEIREATPADASAIADIYNHYVRDTTLTFDLSEVSAEDFRKRMAQIQENYPYLVSTLDEQIIGYAYANQWKTKEACKQTAETTIYLNPNVHGKGYGLRLYNALLTAMPLFDLATAIGGITIPNDASIRLHEKLGFEKVGEFKKVGYKFEQWHNVGYWQKHV